MIEDIIYWLTVFEDKDIVKRKINKQYPDRLTDEQLKKILKLKFKGWGRFSRKFLAGIKGDMGTTIIDMLEDADDRFLYCNYCPNLMQIINKDEKIKQIIDDNRPRYDGIHLRPAGAMCDAAIKFDSNISFEYAEGKTANAKSVISILASGVKCGDEITLIADGSDEEEALKTVSEKFKEALKD